MTERRAQAPRTACAEAEGGQVRVPAVLAYLLQLLRQEAAASRTAARAYAQVSMYASQAQLGVRLDEALGLAPVAGQAPWWRHPQDLGLWLERLGDLVWAFDGFWTVRCRKAAERARIYAADRWPKVEGLDAEPSADPVDQALFDLHRLAPFVGVAWPLGWRAIERRLSAGAMAATTPARDGSDKLETAPQ